MALTRVLVGLSVLVVMLDPAKAEAQNDVGTMMGGNKIEHFYGTREALETRGEFERWLAEQGDAEWKKAALAWISLQPPEEDNDPGVKIASAKGVEAIANKTGHRFGRQEGEPWLIWFEGRKAPRRIVLQLTDPDRTEVECGLRSALAQEAEFLGVFRHQGRLFCVPRSKPAAG